MNFLRIGNGTAGKHLAWEMAKAGQQTAMVERKYLGGACPNIACLPSKNLIYSARVASLARRGAEFGLEMNSLEISMEGVQRRKRAMVEEQRQLHVDLNAVSGAELIMGEGRFIAPRTVDVALDDGGTRRICGDRVFLKDRRIRVNAVSPGFTDTPAWHSTAAVEQGLKIFSNSVPLGRAGTPDEVAKAVVFRASDDSGYVTGTEFFVDGGFAQV